MTQLSKHFSLEELTRSATAIRYNIENTPDAQAIENLRHLCQQTLEPLRCRFGVLRITSGFRSEALNHKIGGHPHSQHLIGCAADIQALHPRRRAENHGLRPAVRAVRPVYPGA